MAGIDMLTIRYKTYAFLLSASPIIIAMSPIMILTTECHNGSEPKAIPGITASIPITATMIPTIINVILLISPLSFPIINVFQYLSILLKIGFNNICILFKDYKDVELY